MKHVSLLFLLIFPAFLARLNAQNPYVQMVYSVDTTRNVRYGTAIDYAGDTVELLLDIYKPVSDSNCLRPLMIMVHGGAWIGGSKDDYNMARFSRELAMRGWVVACINYRLGTHKAANYDMYALCNTSISQPCGYICDSAEIYRANYRGMQDAKAAIRFMKNRHLSDSSDPENAFICGESAGGFIALATAYTDRSSEKHASCYSIADAPTPDNDMKTYGCVPTTISFKRPDLGSIEGDQNLGGYDASVKGVASIYGAMMDTSILTQKDSLPCVYLYHQGSDVVVNYEYGKILGRTSWECYAQTNLCQQYYFYPNAYGGSALSKILKNGIHYNRHLQSSIVANYSYMNNCLSNGHSIDNFTTVTANICNLFSERLKAFGNDPKTNCSKIGMQTVKTPRVSLYPNPVKNKLYVSGAGIGNAMLMDCNGRMLMNVQCTNDLALDCSALKPGIYILHCPNGSVQKIMKVQD